MDAIPTNDLRRAVASASLISSEQDGEALSAARALSRLLHKNGLDAAGVIQAGLEALSSSPPHAKPLCPSHQIAAATALGFPELLSEWETEFLRSISIRPAITKKQKAKLAAISSRIERSRR